MRPEARCLVEMEMAASENMALATIAPPMHPSAWNGQVGGGVPPLEPAETGIDEGDDRVEVTPRDRAEHQDDGKEARRRGRRVLEEFEARVARGEVLRRDARTDDDGAPGRRCPRTRPAAAATRRCPSSTRPSTFASFSSRTSRSASHPRHRLTYDRTGRSTTRLRPGPSRRGRRQGRCRPPTERRRGRSPRPCPGRRSSRSSALGPRSRSPSSFRRPVAAVTSSAVSTSTPRWLRAPLHPVSPSASGPRSRRA